MRTLLTPILVVLLAANAAAQTTRVEAIAEEQAEKAKQLGTEGASDAERIIRQVLLSPLLSGGDGIYPWFGSVFGGTGAGIGVGFLKRLEKDAFVDVHSAISINSSMLVRATFAAPALWRGRVQVDTTAHWLDARGVSFYGFGQDSSLEARERYDYNPFEVGGNVTLRPMRFVSVSGSYMMLNFDTHRDTPRFSDRDAPGLDREFKYHVARATAIVDSRPSPGYSTRGGFVRASFERNEEMTGKASSFDAQEIELMHQLPLVREQFVLAGRALMTFTQPDQDHEVPVILSPYLGSGSALRGFANRRFTDRNRMLLSGEYRWRPSRYVDMALFLDAGQVARDRRDFDLSLFDVAWGIGARFHGPNFNALRIEVARGREGIRLIFAGSQPF